MVTAWETCAAGLSILPRQDVAAIAQAGGGQRRHAAKLPAAHQPDRRVGRQRKCRRHESTAELPRRLGHSLGLFRAQRIQPSGQGRHPVSPALPPPAMPHSPPRRGRSPACRPESPAGIWTIDSRLSMPFSACDLDRHAQHRQRRPGRAHAGQMGRAAGSGDDHLQAAIPRGHGIVAQPVRRAVGGDDPDLVRHRQARRASRRHGVRVGQSDWLPMMIPTSGAS